MKICLCLKLWNRRAHPQILDSSFLPRIIIERPSDNIHLERALTVFLKLDFVICLNVGFDLRKKDHLDPDNPGDPGDPDDPDDYDFHDDHDDHD